MIAMPLLLLVKANLAGSAAICAVLALRKLVRSRWGAQAAYGLWILPPMATAASLLPARTVVIPVRQLHASAQSVSATFPAPAAGDYSPLLLAFWGVGIALSLIVLIGRQRRFMARLGRLSPTADRRVVSSEWPDVGPAVVGVLTPRIILPADFEEQYDPVERAAIMIHEKGHLSAGHIQINCLVALLRCLCWFNPFVHIAARALRLDQELTCDARVLAQFPAGRRAYGEALLRTQLNALPLPLGCYWPSSGAEPLKERLIMLKMPVPSRRARLAGAGLTVLAAAATAVAAWAAQPPQKIPDPVQVDAEARVFARQFLEGQLAKTADPAERQALIQRMADIETSPSQLTWTPSASAQPASFKTVQAPPDPAVPQVSISNSVAGHKDLAPPPKQPPASSLINDPNWINPPTSADLAPYYPADAVKQEQQGMVMLRCQVGETGKPQDCSVLSETPEGANFGDAALKMAETFTLKPPANGASATVNIPIRFALQ